MCAQHFRRVVRHGVGGGVCRCVCVFVHGDEDDGVGDEGRRMVVSGHKLVSRAIVLAVPGGREAMAIPAHGQPGTRHTSTHQRVSDRGHGGAAR